jgi:hypothetical protein
MKAVVGSVAQSKRIRLAKAASSFARFAAAAEAGGGIGGGEHHAKAAYLRLASSAFDELVRVQPDVGARDMEKKRGKRSSDGRTLGEEESEDGGMETGEVVDSNIKRLKIEK